MPHMSPIMLHLNGISVMYHALSVGRGEPTELEGGAHAPSVGPGRRHTINV